jgi:hypothetical protein
MRAQGSKQSTLGCIAGGQVQQQRNLSASWVGYIRCSVLNCQPSLLPGPASAAPSS